MIAVATAGLFKHKHKQRYTFKIDLIKDTEPSNQKSQWKEGEKSPAPNGIWTHDR